MNIQLIKSRRDYANALKHVERLMDAKPGSTQEDELDVLATLISTYEDKHFQVTASDPVEAILFRMEQQGLTRSDLEPFIGTSGRVSEVLSRKRGLSLGIIRKLHAGLRIPLANLVGAE